MGTDKREQELPFIGGICAIRGSTAVLDQIRLRCLAEHTLSPSEWGEGMVQAAVSCDRNRMGRQLDESTCPTGLVGVLQPDRTALRTPREPV